MISDQLKLIKAIAPTPHPRVELPQLRSQEASFNLAWEVLKQDMKIKEYWSTNK